MKKLRLLLAVTFFGLATLMVAKAAIIDQESYNNVGWVKSGYPSSAEVRHFKMVDTRI